MPNMTVPSSAPGFKSLPAEIKVGGGNNPWVRMLAQSPTGYGRLTLRTRGGFNLQGLGGLRGLRGVRGLGDDDSGDDDSGITDNGNLDLPITSTIVSTDLTTALPSIPTGLPLCVMDPTNPNCNLSSVNNPTATATQNDQATAQLAALYPPSSVYSGPTIVSPSAATPPAPAGYQWATLVNAASQNVAKVLAISQGGSTVTLPNGTQLVYGSAQAAASGASGISLTSAGLTIGGVNMMPILLIGGALLLLMSMDGRK